MKKLFGTIAIVAIVAAESWNYNQSLNEVELSDLALANVEALAYSEGGITGDCNSSTVITTECKAVCICGTIWYPSPRVPKAVAANVSGSCPRCGSTHWNAYH